MTKHKKTSPARKDTQETRRLVRWLAERHGMTRHDTIALARRFIDRARERHFASGWWLELFASQFLTHVGPHRRIRCGEETHLSHLIPSPGELCHDCGCALGEYHVFGCDAEECSNCGQQVFCCDCVGGDDGREPSAN
jgi:hypothetical protein